MDLKIDRRPMSRGVTQLMYVGDDDAVENADARESHLMFGGIAALVAMHTKGVARLAALGVVGYAALSVFRTLKR